MAHVEEIIERIRATPSVETYVICDSAPGGAIYRRAPGTTEERAAAVAEALRPLASNAQGVVRDLDPANELQFVRIKTKKRELMMGVDDDFLAIILQRWAPSSTGVGGGDAP